MNIQQMQQDLISQINNIHDADILRMLDEELAFSLGSKEDLASLLTKDDFNELTALAADPEKDTISLNEFNSIMDQWRMK